MRYVLFVSRDSVTSYATGRSGFDSPVLFHHDSHGKQQLCHYLAERSGSVFSVVLDTRDEEHLIETLPVLRGREKSQALKQVVKRVANPDAMLHIAVKSFKASQVGKLRVAISQAGRQSDCMHWLEVLNENQVLIDSVCPMSLLAREIVNRLQLSTSLCILRLQCNDYRILGYCGDSPVINRHVDTSLTSVDQLLNEIEKTCDYLSHYDSTESIERPLQKPADVVVVNQIATLIGFVPSEMKKQLENRGVQVISERKLYSQLSGGNPPTSFAFEMMVRLMANRRVRATTSYRGNFRSHLQQRKLKHGLLAGMLCCAGLSAFATAAAVKVGDTYTSLQTVLQAQSERLELVNVDTTVESSQVDVLRQSIILARSIEHSMHYTPLHFLSPFAMDLTLYPEVSITSVQWTSSLPLEFADSAEDGDAYVYDASVKGYLNFADGELTEAVGRFNGFIVQLRNSMRYDVVDVIEAPFGISDQATTFASPDHNGAAVFVISLRVAGDSHE